MPRARLCPEDSIQDSRRTKRSLSLSRMIHNVSLSHISTRSCFSSCCSQLFISSAKPLPTADPVWLGMYFLTSHDLAPGPLIAFPHSVINPPSSGNDFNAFSAAAQQIGSSEQPVRLSGISSNELRNSHLRQVADNGFVSGGIGATATVAPSAGQACTTTTVTAGGSTSVQSQCSGGDRKSVV